MPELPILSGKQTIQALERLGFRQVRQRGSHVVLRMSHPQGDKGCVVPLHRELKTGTLRGILRQAKVSHQEFVSALS